MKLLPFLAFLLFLLGSGLAGLIFWVNRKAPKHVSLALAAFFYAWWAFCWIFASGLGDLRQAYLWFEISQWGEVMIFPCVLWFNLEFVGGSRSSVARFVLPFTVLWAMTFVLPYLSNHAGLRLAEFYYVAMKDSPWGNVGVAGQNLWLMHVSYLVFLVGILGLAGLMAYRSRKATSARVRRQYLVNALGFLSVPLVDVLDEFLGAALGWPRLDLLVVGYYVIGVNFYLIGRYRFLLRDQPLAGWQVGNLIRDPVFILDGQLRITNANPPAREWLATVGVKDLVPLASFSGLFPRPDDFAEAWAAVRERRSSRQTIVTQKNGTVFVSLSAEFDALGDIVGAVALLTVPKVTENPVFGSYGLSEREYEVVLMLLQGKATKEIAHALFISPGTVKNHIYNIYKKTGADSRLRLNHLLRPTST